MELPPLESKYTPPVSRQIIKQSDNKPILMAIGVLSLLSLIFSLLAYGSSNSANQNTIGLSAGINSTIKNVITNSLTPVVNNVDTFTINSLNADTEVNSKISNLSSDISGSNASTDTKISGLSSQISQSITTIDTNVLSNDGVIQSEVIQLLNNESNTIKSILKENNSLLKQEIILNRSNYTIPANGYYYGTMLEKFANHINFTANQSVILNILSYQQFANLATNKSFSTISTFSGNSESLWENLSEGCNAYVFVISSTSGFKIRLNQSVIYKPSNTSTGIC